MFDVVTEICNETGSWLKDHDLTADFVRALELPEVEHEFSTHSGEILFDIVGQKFALENRKILFRKHSRHEKKLSYKLHTNRELDLMLKNKKNFAVFQKHTSEDYDVYNGQNFEKYCELVNSCKIVLEEIEYYFKFLDGYEWKKESYLLLQSCRNLLGNCEKTEFMEGSLLGYTKQQNIEFLDKIHARP